MVKGQFALIQRDRHGTNGPWQKQSLAFWVQKHHIRKEHWNERHAASVAFMSRKDWLLSKNSELGIL